MRGVEAVQRELGFELSAPDELAGLPRTDVRLVNVAGEPGALSTYGEGMGAIVVLQHAAGEERGPGLPLPRINIDGATGSELATPLGTVVTFRRGDVSYVVARLRPAGGRRERGARAVMLPIEARGLVKRYGDITAVDHVDLSVGRRRRLRLPRPQRRRQDDVAADAARADPARRGLRAAVRP